MRGFRRSLDDPGLSCHCRVGLVAQAYADFSGHEPSPAWWAFYFGLLPIAAIIMIVVLTSARRNRPWALSTGLAAMVAGLGAIFGFTFLDEHLNMVTPITYENQTGLLVQVLHQKDGEPGLQLDFPAVRGTYVNVVGYRVQGQWIRIVAQWRDGSTVLDRSYTWDELRGDGGRIVIVSPKS